MQKTLNPTAATAPHPRPQPEPPARLDAYLPIHKALRAAMATMLIDLGRLDSADADECGRVLGTLASLLDLLEDHLLHEERFVHPAIESAQQGLLVGIDADHLDHRRAIAGLRAEAQALRQAPGEAGALRLYRRFALFMAENLAHMHVEETQLNAVLWAFYGDDELARIHERVLAQIEPARQMATLRLMLPALNPAQRAGLLRQMQAKAPPAAFQPVLALAREVLCAGSWTRLAQSLGLQPSPSREASPRP